LHRLEVSPARARVGTGHGRARAAGRPDHGPRSERPGAGLPPARPVHRHRPRRRGRRRPRVPGHVARILIGGPVAGIDEQLTKYLADAHSIEVQALAQLKRAPAIAGDDAIAAAFREHLAETERHERLIRELLEQRGESPSRVKDTVMAVGGAGFLLFARMQPDTPGKLCAHALSYEALELASYELLARVATRAGETAVADTATTIRDDERAMMQRLESLFDASVDASLRQHPRDDLRELVRKYLADAHALEEQAAQLLARAPKL